MELHGMGGGGGGVLIGGWERMGAMLVCGKNLQISAKKGWVGVANGPKTIFTVGSVNFSLTPLG